MKKYFLFSAFFITFVACYSCDDGRIYEKESLIPQDGLTLKFTGELKGVASWPEKYSVCLAGFNEESDYAILSKVITASSSNEPIQLQMNGINKEISQVGLCVTNRLRKRIVTFAQLDKETISTTKDTLRLTVGTLDVALFQSLQSEIFNSSCIACHGATGKAARNLFLTEGKSHAALIGQPSETIEGAILVKPGNASESLLPRVLSEEGVLQHSHTDLLDAKKKSTLISLINDWIEAGANK